MKNVIVAVLAIVSAFVGINVYQYQQQNFYTIDGSKHNWSALEGNWLVVNYFAEWCAPCLKEVPELNAFHLASDNKNQKIYAVSFDVLDDQTLNNIASKYQMRFPLLSLSQGNHQKFEKPAQLPTTYIVDPNGKVVKTLKGQISAAELQGWIDKLQRL